MSAVVHEKFGNQVPFADPPWYQGFATTVYHATHVAWRAKVRDFAERELMPFAETWDELGELPADVRRRAYEHGIVGWPRSVGGLLSDEFDIFHHLIATDELTRVCGSGLVAALHGGQSIGLPPLMAHGSDELKQRVLPSLVSGQRFIALALTEPWVGSDLAHLETTATRDGDYYVVNGAKKFITGGGSASYFTTAVRTGADGIGGISLLLIERDLPGVAVRRLKTQGWWMSYTAFISFDNVRVRADNLIGNENHGFIPIMTNFNMERLMLVVQCIRCARVCLEDAIVYARSRRTFGRRLKEHQVIRHKIANMAREIEACHAWMENCALQYHEGVDAVTLGRTTALLKVQATRMLEMAARDASQILGGNAYLRTGPGARIERIYREVRVMAIGGGSEEILLDLTARMAKL